MHLDNAYTTWGQRVCVYYIAHIDPTHCTRFAKCNPSFENRENGGRATGSHPKVNEEPQSKGGENARNGREPHQRVGGSWEVAPVAEKVASWEIAPTTKAVVEPIITNNQHCGDNEWPSAAKGTDGLRKLEDWLHQSDWSTGDLKSYAELLQENFDGPNQLSQIYSMVLPDESKAFDCQQFFSDVGVEDPLHRRLFEAWFKREFSTANKLSANKHVLAPGQLVG